MVALGLYETARGARLGIDGGMLSVWRTRPAPQVGALEPGALTL